MGSDPDDGPTDWRLAYAKRREAQGTHKWRYDPTTEPNRVSNMDLEWDTTRGACTVSPLNSEYECDHVHYEGSARGDQWVSSILCLPEGDWEGPRPVRVNDYVRSGGIVGGWHGE